MTFRGKIDDVRQRTAVLERSTRQRTDRQEELARAVVINDMLDDAIRQHNRAPINAHSTNNAQRIVRAARHLRRLANHGTTPNWLIARAARRHSRLANPGPVLISGRPPHHYYTHATEINVETGESRDIHFDYRHRSPHWIYDEATGAYVRRHVETIDLTE